MLILTRKISESLIIGGNVTVTISGPQGGQIKIGIVMLRHIAVNRQEIYDLIQAEKGVMNGN